MKGPFVLDHPVRFRLLLFSITETPNGDDRGNCRT